MEPLIKKLLEFRNNRDWEQFHTPRNLATSLSLEAAEVLEIFQWKLDDRVNEQDLKKLKEELADVFCYLLLLSQALNIDLIKITQDKVNINGIKYPVEKVKGKSTKYTDL